MRLLHTNDVPELTEFIGDDIPPYAILSHTWEDEEVSLQQLIDPAVCAERKGYRKISKACALAAKEGYGFCWVDTCCIDKQASAELSETINSMYRWYEKAAACYAYLSDLAPGVELDVGLSECRWFSRGWTLQELIAPPEVFFFDCEWNYRGKRSMLAKEISSITRIPESILRKEARPSDFCIAARMSWASKRETTRIEDAAYSLMGIFDVNMPLIYGEREKAFRRLQDLIIQTAGDLSMLAWTYESEDCPEFTGFFAESPREFWNCSNMMTTQGDSIEPDLAMTIRGIQMDTNLVHLHLNKTAYQPVLDVSCRLGDIYVGVHLRKIGGNRYARWKPNLLGLFTSRSDLGLVTQRKYGPVTPHAASQVYDTWTLPPETVVLPQKLPESFPFHPKNPVLGNRNSALRLSWKINLGDNSPLELGRQMVYPQSHWDRQDQVFFSTDSVTPPWSAMTLSITRKDSKWPYPDSVRLFVACFYWGLAAKYIPKAVLVNCGDLRSDALSAFEFNLNRIKFENSREVEQLLLGTFGKSFVSKQTEVSFPAPGSSRTAIARVRLHNNLKGRNICINPISRLDFDIDWADNTHISDID
ncbi:hypothetical protein OQA88_7696 [Cercophora sp. LCS_1]